MHLQSVWLSWKHLFHCEVFECGAFCVQCFRKCCVVHLFIVFKPLCYPGCRQHRVQQGRLVHPGNLASLFLFTQIQQRCPSCSLGLHWYDLEGPFRRRDRLSEEFILGRRHFLGTFIIFSIGNARCLVRFFCLDGRPEIQWWIWSPVWRSRWVWWSWTWRTVKAFETIVICPGCGSRLSHWRPRPLRCPVPYMTCRQWWPWLPALGVETAAGPEVWSRDCPLYCAIFIIVMKSISCIWLTYLGMNGKIRALESTDTSGLSAGRWCVTGIWSNGRWSYLGIKHGMETLCGPSHSWNVPWARLDPGWDPHREITPEQTPIWSHVADSAHLPLGSARQRTICGRTPVTATSYRWLSGRLTWHSSRHGFISATMSK